uniref:Uncharacterized protein n=1 Tax=Chenopodium quinoa TaxID=63459 RepID=A0A803M328_CHEQI
MDTSQPLATESFSYSWLATESELHKTISNNISETSHNFDFDISISKTCPSSLVHADKLFSNGLILPQSLDESGDNNYYASTPSPLLISRGGTRVDDVNRITWEVKSWSTNNTPVISSPMRDNSSAYCSAAAAWSDIDESSIRDAILYCKRSSTGLFLHQHLHHSALIPPLANNSATPPQIPPSHPSDQVGAAAIQESHLQVLRQIWWLIAMNPIQYQAMGHSLPPQQWGPSIPPNPPPSTTFWNPLNVQHHFKELHETLSLANAMQKELDMLMKVKEVKGFFEDNRIDLGAQELILMEAANGLMSKLRFLLEPLKFVTDDGTPWEEKSAVVRLSDKINKSKRNKLWRKRKRRRVAESLAKEEEQFKKLDREADEWRAKEIAKDMAEQKVEKMKVIAKQKAKEERKKLEAELELALMVEKLQELRSVRIQKLKKQGHFLPEEDDKFLERVRAAVEEEERQAKAAAATGSAKNAIAAAEESRKFTQGSKLEPKVETSKDIGEESEEQRTQSKSGLDSLASTSKETENQGSDRQSHGAYDYVANLPPEFYHYYHGSNTDMGTLIEVRRTWDAYIRPGGSRIPSHWVQPPPPADETLLGKDNSAVHILNEQQGVVTDINQQRWQSKKYLDSCEKRRCSQAHHLASASIHGKCMLHSPQRI